jgi:3' terminal RNA ribose 2'-O-methyltransferase Hen1
MLLTITSVTPPATDLGFVLHKNPAALRSVDVGFGVAHAFYPEAGPQRCTIALLVEVDPVALARRQGAGLPAAEAGGFPLARYVNDRPYAASSFLSVALRRVFGTALRGTCEARPELPGRLLELTAELPVLPCRGGEALLRELFEPLGYQVSAVPIALDPHFPDWGDSPYFSVRLSGACRVQDLLGHLYVLLPVLDDGKHYWITADEIGKLTGPAAEWLAGHPQRDVIIRRYLKHQPALASQALAQLADNTVPADGDQPAGDNLADGSLAAGDTGAGAARARLRDLRADAVLAELAAAGARRVLDLGCGDGRLLARLLADPRFEAITGVDVSAAALARAARRLHTDELAPRQRDRVQLLHGSLCYADKRLAGYDAAVLMEVIEHVDPGRLDAVTHAVLGVAAPGTVLVSTPNADYNARYPGLAPGARRHPDHRFEWGQAEFRAWATAAAARYGYQARFAGVGPGDPGDPAAGPPTQLAVLTR